MVINLDRSDIEKAIAKYVVEEVLGYGRKGEFDIKVTQGKAASAKVELTKAAVDIAE